MRGIFNSGCMMLDSELQRSNKTHRATQWRINSEGCGDAILFATQKESVSTWQPPIT